MSPDTAQTVPSEKAEPKAEVARQAEPIEQKEAPAGPPAPGPTGEAAPVPPQVAAPVETPIAAAPPPPRPVHGRWRSIVTVGGTLLFLFAAWEVFTYFIAYTDDAYVRSDLVAVAP